MSATLNYIILYIIIYVYTYITTGQQQTNAVAKTRKSLLISPSPLDDL